MLTVQELSKLLNEITILYVEDDILTKEAIIETLKKFSKNILVADNGEEALEIYDNNEIQLIISDVEMPYMNGVRFIEKIREKDITTPVIIITAHSQNDYLISFANLGIQGYIIKPINFNKLKESLYKAVKYLNKTSNILTRINKNLLYDKTNCLLIDDDIEYKLNKKEKILMDLLLQHKNKVVPYEHIEQAVWYNYDDVMTASALRTVVKTLRKKSKSEFIINVSGIGYKIESEEEAI